MTLDAVGWIASTTQEITSAAVATGVGGVVPTRIFPFADTGAAPAYDAVETAVHASLRRAVRFSPAASQ